MAPPAQIETANMITGGEQRYIPLYITIACDSVPSKLQAKLPIPRRSGWQNRIAIEIGNTVFRDIKS